MSLSIRLKLVFASIIFAISSQVSAQWDTDNNEGAQSGEDGYACVEESDGSVAENIQALLNRGAMHVFPMSDGITVIGCMRSGGTEAERRRR